MANPKAPPSSALSGGRLKRALADADRAGARRIYLLGPDEVKQGAALVRDLETGEHEVLIQGIQARWSTTGHVVVVREDGSLVAAPFDEGSLELMGPVVPLLDDLMLETFAGGTGSSAEMVISDVVMRQKLDYIHYNPVKRGYVDLPEPWRYSSARNYAGTEGLIEIDAWHG